MIPRARWQQIQTLFDQLADLNEPGRSAQLDQQCGDDADLRASVQSLLASDHRHEDRLQQAIGAAAESLLEDHRDRLIGTLVGPYRVVSILGHGGMSTVYRGERDGSAPYRQTVAIKVLQHAFLHPRLRSRLHSERHILATLDHPSIARLIDSGELEDGTPYLVMEHIDGESIDAYCDGRTLFVRERIELFVEVCAAVHYAHRNLVVHRDIKASNIYVTDQGVPKLLDFGVAKLLAPESLSHTLPVTRLQERILTPENAAPEQVLGRPITTATDVYALGVLLYQLLTGRSPYRLLSYSQLQLERAICMDDPARPSAIVVSKLKDESEADRSRISDRRGLSPERLHSRLTGDLDAVVAMAMRKEPDRRYPSVEALADDLRRHLAGEPVRARQGDWRYNAAKFLRRHAWIVAGVAALFCGLLAFTGETLWQNHRISQARDATELERDRARQVSAFLVDVFSRADPFNARGNQPTAVDILDSGAEKIQNNVSLQPEVRAQLLESIGLAYRHQGLLDRAIPLLEKALAIRREAQPKDERAIAASLADLSRALFDAGHVVSAEGYIQEAVRLSEQAGPAASGESADIYLQYGNFELDAKSDPERARSLFNQALAKYRATPGNHALSIGYSYAALASADVWSGNFKDAEIEQQNALQIYRGAIQRNHPDHTVGLATLGYIQTQNGKYAQAEQSLNEAMDIERTVFGADNQRVAAIESDLSNLYARTGDLPRALALSEDALKISTKRDGPDHYMRAFYLDSLAYVKLLNNDVAGAQADVQLALEVFARGSLPARHLYVASSRLLLGEIYLRRGLLTEAEREMRTALDVDVSLVGADNWRSARTAASLGWVLIKSGRDGEGEPMLAAAQHKLATTLGPGNPDTQSATTHLAQYYRDHHRDADASRVLAAGEDH